jgi:hypothetical protein
LADANPGAPWRAALRISEPSQQLSKAIRFLEHAVRAVTPADGMPTLDVLLNSCIENLPREEGLEKLVGRVLRSTLEQLRTRPAREAQVTTAAYRARQGNDKGRYHA